ncbi:MAG: hypothetical protein AYK18_15090 [Theionarchaea archaeon DG-70]|nr:MAG: hypothetical protein AYK18_15090 [Theionarchaea archaeon DG-70]
MRLFVVKTGGRTLRVRKEDFGCAILDRDLYVEGNETVYKVLELFSQGKTLEEAIHILAERENASPEEVRKDVLSLIKMFNDFGWFCEFTETEGE